jgi:predicted amidophosphoribosyltransferase
MSLLVQCPNCVQDCAYDAPTCPNCGQRWPNELLKQQRIRKTLLYIAMFVAFVVASFVGYLINNM